MNKHFQLYYFLIAGFLFFRYLRANKGAIVLLGSFILWGLALYEIREHILYVILMIALLVVEVYVVILKFQKNPRILIIGEGYKPIESIIHYVVFAILVFTVILLIK